jgi:hypothetical protein
MPANRFTALLLALLLNASIVTVAFAANGTPPNTVTQHLISDGGSFKLTINSAPRTIPLNEMFELTIEVRPAKKLNDPNPIWLSINASMPAHQHGMNTKPRVEDMGNGKFVVRGMLFHMAGDWELAFDVVKGSIREHAKTAINLE